MLTGTSNKEWWLEDLQSLINKANQQNIIACFGLLMRYKLFLPTTNGNTALITKLEVHFHQLANIKYKDMQREASCGNAAIQYILAYVFLSSTLDKEKKKGIEWLEKSAYNNYAPAQFQLGMHCQSNKSFEKSEELNNQSAAQGYAPAEYRIGELLLSTDKTQALEWIKKAASHDLALAKFKLVEEYDNALDVTPGNLLPINWYLGAATQGNAQAQYCTGKLYILAGNGNEAINYLTMASNQGEIRSKILLAELYRGKYKNLRIERNEIKALQLFQEIALTENIPEVTKTLESKELQNIATIQEKAEKNDPNAQFKMAEYYEKQNFFQDAIKWYRLSCTQNYVPALRGFSSLIINKVPRKGISAVLYRGVTSGLSFLSSFIRPEEEERIEWNIEEAIECLEKIYQISKDINIAIQLGDIFYQEEFSIPKNCVEAKKWYYIASKSNTYAASRLNEIQEAENSLARYYSRSNS